MNLQEKRFLAAMSAIIAKMAKADGRVTDDEINAVRHVWTQMGLSNEQLKYCSVAFDSACHDQVSLERYIQEFVATKFGEGTRAFLYELLWEIACADGVLHHKEVEALRTLQNLLGVPLESYDYYYRLFIETTHKAIDEIKEQKRREAEQKKRQEEEKKRAEESARKARGERKTHERYSRRTQKSSRPPLESAYDLLGATPSDSFETLKRKYHMAAKQFHPDHLRSDGVPGELIRKANEKMAAINEAWNLIKQSRG